MRVLCATTAGSGHFGPLVPFAIACRDAGHDVKVAAPASFAGAVSRAGFDHLPFADVPADVLGAIFARLPEMSFEQADETVMADVFGRLDAQAALPGVMAAIEQWRPDIVLREPSEFASLVAAERAGVIQVQVAIGVAAVLDAAEPILAAPLAELSVMAGLPDERALEILMTTPQFTCVPATLDTAGSEDLAGDPSARNRQVWRFRDASLSEVAGTLPPPWGDPDHPLVYVTFGSVTAGLAPFAAVYADTLAALRDAPVRVLMTTGAGGDPDRLRPVPANAHVDQWWPQRDVMPHAAAVVGHGGFGTTMTALAAGVPQVVVPLFAGDQFVNARLIAAVGAGIHLPGGPRAMADVPTAVAEVLNDPSFRLATSAIAAEIAALPPAAAAVPILRDLAAT